MVKSNFNFWYNWLFIVSIANLFIGILVAFFPNSFLFSFYTEAIAETFFSGLISDQHKELQSFLFGIIGGTVAGYFVLQTFIVLFPFYRREPWAWYAILIAILTWFVIDSGLSFYHSAAFNVWMINIWPMILICIPLIMTYRNFFPKEGGPDEST